jgi:DNA polymerase III delta prime subunit
MSSEFLWVEKYRPKRISDVILPDNLKNTFIKIVENKEIPNMLFTGGAGLGKTTVAKAICNELQLDYLLVNGSEEGNIDTLRNKIKQFASTVSLQGGYKVVILDEADYLNAQSTQPALRGFIEEFSNNCRFILTCNFKNRIIEPLHSRCSLYEFNTTKTEMVNLARQFMDRVSNILGDEKVSFEKRVVAELIMKYCPDWRRVLNELQRYSISGTIDSGILDNVSDTNYNNLFGFLKEKDFKKMRQWVANNIDVDFSVIIRNVYDKMEEVVDGSSIPQLVLILALNTVACLTEIMANVKFK